MTETITWQPSETKPDTSRTVLVRLKRESGHTETWLGYWDGKEWGDEHGYSVTVSHWAEKPKGPEQPHTA